MTIDPKARLRKLATLKSQIIGATGRLDDLKSERAIHLRALQREGHTLSMLREASGLSREGIRQILGKRDG